MANIDIIKAITAINPDAQVGVNGETYDGIMWRDTPIISQADIEAKQAELQATEDATIAQKPIDKANAKAKLIAGEALTQAEADTIVL